MFTSPRLHKLYNAHLPVAMGVPLINAIYEDNPLVGLYTLPLLIWHPMQLVIGTAIAPRIAEYVKKREEELAARGVEGDKENDDEEEGTQEDQVAAKDISISDRSPDEKSELMELGGTVSSTYKSQE